MRRLALLLWIGCLFAPGIAHAEPVADPILRSPDLLDPHRPPQAENRLTVADGFTLGLAGDMIIARPLSRARAPAGFDTTLSLLRAPDVTFGNLETSIIDIRDFNGAPYPFDGDWANISQPSVAADIRAMGFDMVGRANNHALDWGLEGMRETRRRLDDAGIVYAETGETRDLARAPSYLETPKGRLAILSFATTFRPTSEAMPAGGRAPARPGISALHLTLRVHVTADAMKALAQATCVMDEAHRGNAPATTTLRGTTYGWATNVPLATIASSSGTHKRHERFVLGRAAIGDDIDRILLPAERRTNSRRLHHELIKEEIRILAER
jgi:hypothetical protein